MIDKWTNGSTAQTAIAALAGAAAITLGGCAAPISSTRYIDELKIRNGFVYYLTSSKVEAKISIRLEKCEEPTIVLLDPTITATPAADSKSALRIDPANSLNVFRSNAGSEVSLTTDGRLGKAKAKSDDMTVAFLTKVTDFATRQIGFRNAEFAPTFRVNTTVQKLSCTESSRLAVKEKDDLLLTRAKVLENRRLYAYNGFKKDDDTVLKAYTDALSQIDARIEDVRKSLTKTAVVSLKMTSGDAKGAEIKLLSRFDLLLGWFGDSGEEAGDASCVDPKDAEPHTLGGRLIPYCLEVLVGATRDSDPAISDLDQTMSDNAFPGLIYRIPRPVKVSVQARVPTTGVRFVQPIVRVDAFDPSSSMQLFGPPILRESAQEISRKFVPVPQWGHLATLKSDLSIFGSSGVSVEFDEWSVPKTVTWSAESGGIAGILGLSNQVEAARQKATAPGDPSAGLKNDLLQKMLQSCLEATPATMPAYCANVVK